MMFGKGPCLGALPWIADHDIAAGMAARARSSWSEYSRTSAASEASRCPLRLVLSSRFRARPTRRRNLGSRVVDAGRDSRRLVVRLRHSRKIAEGAFLN